MGQWSLRTIDPFSKITRMKKIIFGLSFLFVLFAGQAFAQGCMESGNDEGVKVVGYIQPQFDYNFLGEDANGASLNESSFLFNRARIGVVGNIPYDFKYYVMLETSAFKSGDPYLLDAFITWTRLGHWASISMGSFKSPFGLELSTPCQSLYTVNRSQMVTELTAPDRDLGFIINGRSDSLTIFGKKTFDLFKYNVALTNGTGLGVYDDNMGKDLIARLVVTPWKHLSIGGSVLSGKQAPSVEGADDDEKMRYGADLEFRYGDFLLQSEYITGEDKGSYTTGGGCGEPLVNHIGSIKRNGFFVQAMYMTPWSIQPVLKFETYEPNAATNFVDHPEAENDVKNVITYGINYWFNEWTRLQLNYLYKSEEAASVEVDNDCFLMQLQVKF